jgi:hypothetical protein
VPFEGLEQGCVLRCAGHDGGEGGGECCEGEVLEG